MSINLQKEFEKLTQKESFKRKFRWYVRAKKDGEVLFENFAKVDSRPNVKIEETETTEINFRNSKMWIPGKSAWDIFVTTIFGIRAEELEKYTTAIRRMNLMELDLYDGCGSLLERWRLRDVKVKNSRVESYYGDDYPHHLEITVKFTDAEYCNQEALRNEPTCKVEQKPKCNMGLGDTVFVRKFRWCFEAPGLPDFMVSTVDFKSDTIEIGVYEVFDSNKRIVVLDWLSKNDFKGPFVFTTFDGCGSPLYRYILSEIEWLGDTASFDYGSSGASIRKCLFRFRKKELLVGDQIKL